ncbi:DNA-binding transcriptional regulator, MarR family [Actinopolymorpha cephalotaxi]|uniref:DNA-binding MarR family transcriptional regulator n=1 Tax=Actinopolymorpha cephalotaxi TaxID=504797 RepID=A0A1I2SAC7_9ACTN|nr:MarR family transcriptional regulator [Actinopolymorpha cephalotaxi]NYH83903.1 DNA-binding MarR family transcriptional regulator [Actinopolymorpha cephalotaxi]SFG49855.1 DNA-binding transcriptional regulator, MarR family [Actinopolymorpha cephalotaxi]
MVKQRGQGGLPEPPAGVPDDDLHSTANFLHSAALRLLRVARTADTEMDLDGPRASLLSVLVFTGPRSVGALARIEQVSAPAITKSVSALEGLGLVDRTPDAADRRVVLVAATPAGQRLLERGRAARVRAVADLLSGLSERDLATLRRAAGLIGHQLVRDAAGDSEQDRR